MLVTELRRKLERMREYAAEELEGYVRVGYEDAIEEVAIWLETGE